MSSNLTMHWYVQFLHYALKCYNDLNYHSIRRVKSVRLTVNAYNAVTLPTDYVDYVRIGVEAGQYVRPLGVNNDFNRMVASDNGGAYTDIIDNNALWFFNGAWYGGGVNAFGEITAGEYGHGNGNERRGFRVIPERNEIQLDVDYAAGCIIVLDYIYFSASATSLTVPPYAEETIESYIKWKWYEQKGDVNRFDVRTAKEEYYNELRKLRAATMRFSKTDLLRTLRRNFMQSPKL